MSSTRWPLMFYPPDLTDNPPSSCCVAGFAWFLLYIKLSCFSCRRRIAACPSYCL